MNTIAIASHTLDDAQRVHYPAALFGLSFPLAVEPMIFTMAGKIARAYSGGYWIFYALSNGGFYMAPSEDGPFQVECENGFRGTLSADALGITACLYAYSLLSFSGTGISEVCAEQYHLLREFMFDHAEVEAILMAID